jgi:hypothetical protein
MRIYESVSVSGGNPLSLKRPPVLKAVSAISLVFLLSACSSPNAIGSDPPADSPHANPPEITNPNTSVGTTGPVPTDPKQIYATALEMWRRPIPKGSCAGCHGADFFDLARIGTNDATLRRRALGDTATQTEAESLVLAVRQMRLDQKLPTENPQTFRPFQPGGAVLPGNTNLERDIRFGKQLKTFSPTIMGARVGTLALAQQSCNELNGINLRTMPTGVEFPLWSSDVFNGNQFGTMNDWVSDIPREPTTQYRAEWLALQSAYLENPSDENFWKMYAKIDTFTETLPGVGNGAKVFTLEKFKSALLGQHMMRAELKPGFDPNNGFAKGPIAFSYLDSPAWKKIIPFDEYYPGGQALWEVGDKGRGVLGLNQNAIGTPLTSVQARLNDPRNLFPAFTLESVPAGMDGKIHEEQVRLAWFWIGFTFNPSLQRVAGSNSTKVGEYMIGSLIEQYMYMHNTFSTQARLCAKGFLPDANYKSSPSFQPEYGYFTGYGREILAWAQKGQAAVPATQKLEQQNLWHTFTANAFRSSLILYSDAISKMDAPTLIKEKSWALGGDGLVGYNKATNRNDDRLALPVFANHFACYQPQFATEDTKLINDVESKLGIPLSSAKTCSTSNPPLQPTNP